MFPETFIARAFFPQGFSVLPYTGILARIRACEQSSNICEQFEHRPNLNWTGPFDTPYVVLLCTRIEFQNEFLRDFPFDLPFTKRNLTGHREKRIRISSYCVESRFLEPNVVSAPESNAVILPPILRIESGFHFTCFLLQVG